MCCDVWIMFNPFFSKHSSDPATNPGSCSVGKSSFVVVKPLAMMVAEALSLQSRLHQQVEAAELGEGSEGKMDLCGCGTPNAINLPLGMVKTIHL